MKNLLVVKIWWVLAIILTLSTTPSVIWANSLVIDPLKFTLKTNTSVITVNEEFEIEITVNYLNIPLNTVFVFEGSNSFRLKLIMPDGFTQTGGTFRDYVEGELSPNSPSLHYTLKGKFTTESGNGIFQLLRSNRKANDQSTFVQVGILKFQMQSQEFPNNASSSRIAVSPTPSNIPYLTIAELRAGVADTARTVFVTDDEKFGLFRYNQSSNLPDDGALTLLAPGRPYERVYEGAVNARWFNIVGDGVTDNTSAIQALLNRTDLPTIYFPKPSISYRLSTISLRSNKTLIFEDGSVVEGLGNLSESQKMIFMYQVQNVTIKGHNVIFRDLKENYTSGQFRHIFSMEGVTNVLIDGISANNSGGDGFYIGTGMQKRYSENVKLINIVADNNRRQGISIISGKNIEINNATLSNTSGTSPSAGLDIEPNKSDEILEGIRIRNVITRNNAGAGITCNLNSIANTDRNVDIVISNHLDEGSYYGFCVTNANGNLSGSIIVNNPVWKNSIRNGFIATNYSSSSSSVELHSPTIINANTIGNTSVHLGAAFLVYRATGATGTSNIGNIHIFNPKIQDTRDTKLIQSAFVFQDLTQVGIVKNCSIIDPISITGLEDGRYACLYGDLAVSDLYGKIQKDLGTGHFLFQHNGYANVVHNATATTLRIVNLSKVITNFPEVRIEVRAPQMIRIVPLTSENIVPISPENGKYIMSNTVGSTITLKKNSDNSWFVKQMTGTWTTAP
jgi:hypothetical protein